MIVSTGVEFSSLLTGSLVSARGAHTRMQGCGYSKRKTHETGAGQSNVCVIVRVVLAAAMPWTGA